MPRKRDADILENSVSMKTVLLGGIAIIAIFAAVLFMSSQPKPSGTGPTALSISINNGATYTRSAEVFLKLSAIGAKDCAYSNDNAAWTAWAPFTDLLRWVIPSDNGAHNVYYKCRAANGATSDVVSDNIIFDNMPPVVEVSTPVSGINYPAPSVQLTFTPTDKISYYVTCTAYLDGAGSSIGRVRSGQQHTASLVTSSASHSLYVRCVDDAGNQGTSETRSFTVVAGGAPPTPIPQGYAAPPVNLNVIINNGAASTDSTGVVLSLTAYNASQCRFSNDGISWTVWEPFLMARAWVLNSGNGLKTVYYQCQNNAGVSSAVYDTIVLNTPAVGVIPQSLSVIINNGATYATSRDVGMNLYAQGASECRYNNDANPYSDWEPYYTYRSWTLTTGDGVKTVYYQCRNANGMSAPAWATIFMDTVQPYRVSDMYGTMQISGKKEVLVFLYWSAVTDPQPGSGVKQYNIYRSYVTEPPYSFEKVGDTVQNNYIDRPQISVPDLSQHTKIAYMVRPLDNAGNEGEGNVYTVSS
ncbi:Uncharacterised protein [Candidatus Norongarragalina meridionalis]|nr:Uncharacterised protein [Candidatus Norongarragalina meridionalis]